MKEEQSSNTSGVSKAVIETEKLLASQKTPAELYGSLEIIDKLVGAYEKQVENMKSLQRSMPWKIFRPWFFQGKGTLSVGIAGSLKSFDGVEVHVTYPTGAKEVYKLEELPIELWPLSQLPKAFIPHRPGEKLGMCIECMRPGAHANNLLDIDDQWRCSPCAKRLIGHGDRGVNLEGVVAIPHSIYQAGVGNWHQIQKQMREKGLVILKEYVEETNKILE